MTNTRTIALSRPLPGGAGEIAQITLTAPRPSQLRGLSIIDLLKLDAGAMCTLLSRISEPALDPRQVDELALADFSALAVAAQGFFKLSSPTAS
jgi:hypothetical protein